MKKLILVACLMATTACASIPPAGDIARAADVGEYCAKVGKIAGVVMIGRQSGTSMAEMMEAFAAKNSPGSEFDWENLGSQMVFQAFEEPRYLADAYQAMAVENFRNAWELGCHSAMR